MAVALVMASDSVSFVRTDQGAGERQLPETASQAEALFQNALRLSVAPDGKPARQQMNEAVRIWLQLKDPERAAKALVQIGDRCRQEKKCADALMYYRHALDLESLPQALRANALNGVGLIYAELYVRDLAVRYFNLALEQADTINNFAAQTIALTGLGDIHRQKGELAEAEQCITRALRLRETNHTEIDPALLYLKGRVSQEQGRVDDAQRAFDDALAIYRNTYDVRGQVRVLCALSTLSLLNANKQVALERAEEARELAKTEGKRFATDGETLNYWEMGWHAWLSCARAERGLGLNARALISYGWAENCFEGIWMMVYFATETSSILLKEEAQAIYREHVDLLVGDGKLMEAAELADSALARTLLNLTGARRARPRSEDTERAADLRELSRSIFRLRSRLLTPGLSREKRLKTQSDLEQAEFQTEETRLRYEMEHIKDRWVWSKLITPEELQKKMVQDHSGLVEFYLGEKRSFAWLFIRDKFYFEILPSRTEIENAVMPYLDHLAAPPNPLYINRDIAKLREQSKALFASLFRGLASHIEPGERLIIVPDGVLHYLPFETLIHNERYLVEDHEISYSPSASVLVQSQDSKGRVETGDRMELLAFGDPIFGPELNASVTRKASRTRKAAVTRTATVTRKNQRRPIDVLRDARISRGFQLAPLPRTRDEVQYIANLFQPGRTRLYLGKDSTEAALKRESLRRYRRLHFATHSLVDESSPSKSAVVLTLNDNPEEDGFLEVDEISDLDLDCDLVVLSACQTGRGQSLSGEGIVGLSRAFLYAGARSVVVSLWSVSDISTGRLMKGFYQHLVGNVSSAAALRLAKLEMLQGAIETRHPYYWAPFVVVGKP